jgi:hypothetical protein
MNSKNEIYLALISDWRRKQNPDPIVHTFLTEGQTNDYFLGAVKAWYYHEADSWNTSPDVILGNFIGCHEDPAILLRPVLCDEANLQNILPTIQFTCNMGQSPECDALIGDEILVGDDRLSKEEKKDFLEKILLQQGVEEKLTDIELSIYGMDYCLSLQGLDFDRILERIVSGLAINSFGTTVKLHFCDLKLGRILRDLALNGSIHYFQWKTDEDPEADNLFYVYKMR